MKREIKLAGVTLVLSATSGAYAQPAPPASGASAVLGSPPGTEYLSVAIIGGLVGGVVGGVIVAVVVVSQLKKALNTASPSKR